MKGYNIINNIIFRNVILNYQKYLSRKIIPNNLKYVQLWHQRTILYVH